MVILALISGLSSNVLSGDKWALAFGKAQDVSKGLGIPTDKVNRVLLALQDYVIKSRDRNPMSEMFPPMKG